MGLARASGVHDRVLPQLLAVGGVSPTASAAAGHLLMDERESPLLVLCLAPA